MAVTVVDDQGGLVAGASVTVTFTGDFTETLTATSNSSGVATVTTSASVRKPSVAACVADINVAGLTWTPFNENC